MPIFSKTGEGKYDFWLLDGHQNFAVIPAGEIQGIDVDVPICLQVGDAQFGGVHILDRHGHWVRKNEVNGCVATLLHRKLSQNGVVHESRRNNGYNIAMRMAPEAFIVLRWFRNRGFSTVTTMYFRQGADEGARLGRYQGQDWAISPYRSF